MAKKPKYLEQSEEEKADTQGIRDADDDIAQERADWVEIASEAAAGRLPPEAGEDARRALAELPKVPVGRLGGQGMRGPASAPAADDPLLMGLAKDPREVAARKPLTEAFSPLTPDDITETFPAGGGTKDQQAQLAVQGLVMNPSKLGNRGARWQAIKAVDRGATGGLGYRVARAMPKAISDAEGLDAEAAALEATGEGLGTGVTDLVEMGAMMTPRGLASRGARAFQQGVLKLPGVGAWVARNPKLGGALVGAGAAAAGNATQKGLQAGVDASLAPGLGVPEQIIQGVKAGGQGAAEGFAGLERDQKGELTYSPMTHLMGAAGGAMAGAGAQVSRSSPNASYIRERGGKVDMFDPGSGGELDTPLLQRGMEPGPMGRPTVTERGKGRVAQDAMNEADAMLTARTAELDAANRTAKQASRIGPQSQQAAANFYTKIRAMVDDPEIPSGVRNEIEREILQDFLKVGRGSPPPGNIKLTPEMAEKMTRKAQRNADYTPEGKRGEADPHWARVAAEARKLVAPDVQAANTTAARGYREVEQARNALGKPAGAHDELGLAERESMGVRAGRRGADTRTAGATTESQERLAALEEAYQAFPGLKRLVEAPELLQRRSNLEFGAIGETGGLLSKVRALGGPLQFLARNWEPAKVRLIAPLLMGTGTATRALAPGSDEFMLMLGDGERQRQKEMR